MSADTDKWPKKIAALTKEQQRISDDFMAHWHTVLPSRYGIINEFNHRYPVQSASAGFHRTLEIGAGLGEHLKYEKLSEDQRRNYFCLDLRPNMVDVIHANHPGVQAIVHDCQQPLTMFADGYFDRILAIHVLEHLPDLPAAIREAYRLIDKQKGTLSVVIPCEGGLFYRLARRLSAQRIFERRYIQSYRWFIEREHLNLPHEILEVLDPYFGIIHRKYFPLAFLPVKAANLVIGLTLKPRSMPVLRAVSKGI